MIELPPFDALALSLHHSPGTQALLVGSGLSRAAGIPTGWEITLDLIRRLGALDGLSEHPNWETWFREKHGKDPNYSEILDTLASTPAERRAILHDYIEKTEDDEPRRPTQAHHAIARLVKAGAVRVIITTNFDRLIESALRDAGIEPTVIASDDAIKGATPLVHAGCTVIKVHGDYLDARIKNTGAELEGYSTGTDRLLDQVFDEFGLVVVGWSGDWDTALRSAILRAPTRRYPLYWAARGDVGGLAQDLLDQRGGRSFPIADADSFFSKLENALEALRQPSRPNPQSIATAIALAKRYCRDDKFDMEWAEFLHAEVEKIRGYVTGPEYPQVQPTKDTLNEVVNSFIVRTEVLRRACLICGKWGTGKANRAVTRAIQSLSFANEPQAGSADYISLRDIGASICFYWNLAGLVDNEDWKSVKILFYAEVKNNGTMTPLVSVLPPEILRSDSWKFLTGLENRQAAISSFLFEKFKIESNDISLSEGRSDELFDEAEFFVSLEFAHQRRLSEETTGAWFWAPPGRFLWKSRGHMWNVKLTRIEKLPDSDPIYQAGLLGGNVTTAKPTLQAVRELFGSVSSRLF